MDTLIGSAKLNGIDQETRIAGHPAQRPDELLPWHRKADQHKKSRLAAWLTREKPSFASVWVYPEIDNRIEIELEEKDLRIDTYRASGAGGQHISKTEHSANL